MIRNSELPFPAANLRWTARRKAVLVQALDDETLSSAQACALYAISEEEIAHWRMLLQRVGMQGLAAKYSVNYRSTPPSITDVA